jgi:hypothetical protein
MKSLKSIYIIALLSAFCFFIDSCHSGPYEINSFLIKVDSINVPSSIHSNTPFDIKFFGTIGTNGCYDFLDFYQTENDNEIAIEAWGTLNYQAKVCPTNMVYLDGRTKSVTITNPGIYYIRIKNPRSNDIHRQVTVI